MRSTRLVEKQQNKTAKLPKNLYLTGPKSLMDGKRRQVQRVLKSSVMMDWLKQDSQDTRKPISMT